MKPKPSRSRWKIIIGIIAAVFALCCVGIVALAVLNPGIVSTTTPTLTSTVTFTLIPTHTVTPTITLTLTLLPTNTPLPTDTAIPTFTVVVIIPTLQPVAACPCTGDTLNCSDFSSQSSAQACMAYCISQGAGDIHNLDGDANGLACEGLP